MREFERRGRLTVHHLLAELWDGVDWVLVEGFKEQRPAQDRSLACRARAAGALPGRRPIVAIATDSPEACHRKPPCGRCWI
jgi:molybdopterin-guanine dinucleotide biosynthesis protein B